MPLHVPESLFEHYLYENSTKAKELFSDASIGPEDPLFIDFFDTFSDIPEYQGKLAEWALYEEDLEEISEIYDLIKDIKDKKISITRDIEEFKTARQFKKYLNELISNYEEQSKEEREELPRATRERIDNIDLHDKEAGGDESEDESEEIEDEESEQEPADPDISQFKETNVSAEEEDEWEKIIRECKLADLESITGSVKYRGIFITQEVNSYPLKGEIGQGLYVWAELTTLRNWDGKDISKLKGRFKFGQYGASAQVGKTAMETIASYSGPFTTPRVILFIRSLKHDINNIPFKNAYYAEQTIADKLRSDGYSGSSRVKSTELYYKKGNSLKDLIEIINKVLTGSTRNSLILREEQYTGSNKIVKYFDSIKEEQANDPSIHGDFLLAAKMRYGKNITVLQAIKELSDIDPSIYQNNLVITYKPAVFSSLKDDIGSFKEFENFEVVDIAKGQSPKKEDSVRIFISSAQYAMYGSNKRDDEDINESVKEGETSKSEKLHKLDQEDEVRRLQKDAYKEYENNIDRLKDYKFGIIMADEYHYGTKSANFRWLLSQLDYKNIIYVSGTALKDMATGRFNNDQVYNWTYIDEQDWKQKEKDDHKKNPLGNYPHLAMPTMKFYKMELGPEARRLADKLSTPEEAFSFTKMLKVNKSGPDKGKLINHNLAKVLIEQILDKNNQLYSIMGATDVNTTYMNHMFWVLPKNTAGIKAFANIMRSIPWIKKKYEIIEATGELNNNIDKVKQKIQEAENNNKGSITLSCYRFKEGTTVPEWGAVVMLDDGNSAEEYLQAIFRCQSPARKGDPLKEYCYVFDFNPQRLLLLYHDIAEWAAKDPGESQYELIEKFLNYAPIVQAGDQRFEPVNIQEIINNFRSHGSFSEKIANDRVFNYNNLEKLLNNKRLIDQIENISSKKDSTEIKVSDNDLSKAKNAEIERRSKEDGNEDMTDEEVNLEIQKEKIRNILKRIPTYLFVSDNDEQTVEDIYKNYSEEDNKTFSDICGVDIDFLREIVEMGIINSREINHTIAYFSEAIKKLEDKPTLEGAENFIKNHLILAGEETSTPNSIVNEMLDKLPEEIWSDPDATFCDPVCGTGKFLMGILERLMEGLKEEIPDEEERKIHIIENQIYGVDNVKFKTIIAQNLLGTKGLNHHIINDDSLKLNWNDMPKFDVVVGNPPYLNNLHLRFLEIAYDISNRYVLWLSPSSWILDEKLINQSFKNARNLVAENIKEITLFNGNAIFNVAMFLPFSIISIDKKFKGNQIEVVDKISGTKEKYNTIEDINKWNNVEIYPFLKAKILKLSKNDNLENHVNENNGPFVINFTVLRGHTHKKLGVDKMVLDDFYSFFPKDIKITKKIEDRSHKVTKDKEFFFSFKTEKEANNFLNFLKTRWAMFALSIYKNNQQLKRGELASVPWLDWSRPWTEKDFEELIGATPEEKEFVYKNIPDYYGISE